MDVYDDLAAEFDRLDEVLTGLDAPAWERPSACAGWSIGDVVLHLAQTNELVLASAAGHDSAFQREPGVALDDMMDRLVADGHRLARPPHPPVRARRGRRTGGTRPMRTDRPRRRHLGVR
ncbi:maleylpyruvate isomerase N-terminal domain-containing protein [Spirillospora sp. NPDC052242]